MWSHDAIVYGRPERWGSICNYKFVVYFISGHEYFIIFQIRRYSKAIGRGTTDKQYTSLNIVRERHCSKTHNDRSSKHKSEERIGHKRPKKTLVEVGILSCHHFEK